MWKNTCALLAKQGLTPWRGKMVTRNLMLQENLGLQTIKKFGVPTFEFGVAKSADEAERIAVSMGGSDFVIKAQVTAGGRGKGRFESGLRGGVQMVFSPKEVRHVAERMLGHRLITKQTGEAGKLCEEVLVCNRVFARREYYFSITTDRERDCPVMIGSSRGGVNIEEVAKEEPEAVITMHVDMNTGVTRSVAEEMARKMGFSAEMMSQAADSFQTLYKAFVDCDCTLLEINPLAEDNHGRVFCMDCKMLIDDNADFRHKDLVEEALKHTAEEDPMEKAAAKAGINYIRLNGNIGCMVNGAGLAMATMDIIKLHGGDPANFLDIGGGASVEQVTEAFRIVLADKNVAAILVNIFGGIIRCDVIARGIIAAVAELDVQVPIVVRLQGTNQSEAHALLAHSNTKIMSRDCLDEASKLACNLANIVTLAKKAAIGVQFELPI